MREQARKTRPVSGSPRRLIPVAATIAAAAWLATMPGAHAEATASPTAPIGACPDGISVDLDSAVICVIAASPAPEISMADAQVTRAQETLLVHGPVEAGDAADLYRVSAEQENPLAEYDLAYFYEHGIGVARDPSQALTLYRRALTHAADDQLRLTAEAAISALESRAMPAPEPAVPAAADVAPQRYPVAAGSLPPVMAGVPPGAVASPSPATDVSPGDLSPVLADVPPGPVTSLPPPSVGVSPGSLGMVALAQAAVAESPAADTTIVSSPPPPPSAAASEPASPPPPAAASATADSSQIHPAPDAPAAAAAAAVATPAAPAPMVAVPAAGSPTAAPTTPAVSAAPTTPAVSVAPTTAAVAAAPTTPAVSTAPTTPAVSAAPVAPAAPAPAAPARQVIVAAPLEVLPAALVASLVSHGNEMLRLGDIGAARLLYERAANAGSAEAAVGVGKTHDARFLVQVRAVGIAPDAEAAAGWYRRAVALGDRDAGRLLAGLESRGTKSSER